jgi:TRAP-type C4-dicarboxylate transport system substrate-binding protein
MSGGALTIRTYPGGELGAGGAAQFKRAVDGIADITWGLQGYTSSVFPRTTLVEMPAIARDSPDLVRRLWAVFDKWIAPEYRRVKVLALWVGEAPVFMSRNKPIRTLDDLKGMKIRTPSAAQAGLLKALGATPVAIDAAKMYQALETGQVDALFVPPSTIRSFKLAEVARYFTTGLPFGRSPFFTVMNRKAYESLPPQHKALIDGTTGAAWSAKATAIYEKAGAGGLALVRKSGKHQIFAFSAADEKRGRAILLEARAQILAQKEKQGVPARAIVAAMEAAN